MSKEFTPIPFKPLCNDLWVFFMYGGIVSWFIERYETKKASLYDLEKILLEPFSVKAFVFITTIGFVLVSLRSFSLGMSEEKAAECWFMRNIFVPISEVGLSTGFIILGMSMGIMSYFSILGSNIEGAHKLVVENFKIASLVAFLIIPIYFQQRTLFAKTKIEQIMLPIIITLYLTIIYGTLWYLNTEVFWKLLIITSVLVLVSWNLVKWWASKQVQQTV